MFVSMCVASNVHLDDFDVNFISRVAAAAFKHMPI